MKQLSIAFFGIVLGMILTRTRNASLLTAWNWTMERIEEVNETIQLRYGE